ncbi:unnamed protein product [Staurois parvus]|uniref:Uncharacterized protein n=1 Tax=Staurois parvus TaxID=386267 RepID=A0ABN9CSK9_9NEOB|nr:unnamed protein product [Staurois parvus]
MQFVPEVAPNASAGHRRVENRPIFRPKIKSADFRIVSGRFGRPFFGILAVFVFR